MPPPVCGTLGGKNLDATRDTAEREKHPAVQLDGVRRASI